MHLPIYYKDPVLSIFLTIITRFFAVSQIIFFYPFSQQLRRLFVMSSAAKTGRLRESSLAEKIEDLFAEHGPPTHLFSLIAHSAIVVHFPPILSKTVENCEK